MQDNNLPFQIISDQAQQAKDVLGVNTVSHYFKKVFNMILEIGMYGLFMIGLWLIFQIPIDPIQLEKRINPDTEIISTVKNRQITDVMIVIRTGVFFISLGPLFAGILLGGVRRKNNKMKKTAEFLDKIKTIADNELKMVSNQANSM